MSADALQALRELIERPAKVNKTGRIPQDFDDAVSQFRDCIGASSKRPKLKRHALPKAIKVAVFSDPHCPFHDNDTLSAFFTATHDADLCVIGGDLMDCYSVSRFAKYEPVQIKDEIASATWLIEECAKRYPAVKVIGGNHDARIEKMLATSGDGNLIQALIFLSSTGALSIPEKICRAYANVEYVSNPVDRFRADWHCLIGDVLVSHAEKFSKVPGSALRQVRDGFHEFSGIYKVDGWKVLLQAHTHQLSHLYTGASTQLLEIGCTCRLHGYQVTPRMNGASQKQGWATFEQVHGVTKPESVRLMPWSLMR